MPVKAELPRKAEFKYSLLRHIVGSGDQQDTKSSLNLRRHPKHRPTSVAHSDFEHKPANEVELSLVLIPQVYLFLNNDTPFN